MTKSAFVAIVGKPNVGKSSLLNLLVGEKIAIISDKPQTTRTRITGVLTEGEVQLVFIDTPGLHKPKNKLGDYMVKQVSDSVGDVDCAVLVTDPFGEIVDSERQLIENIKELHLPAILVINKIDTLANKEDMVKKMVALSEMYDFTEVVPISVKERDGTDLLLKLIQDQAQEGPHFFPSDTLTDQPEKVIAAEIIREKVLRNMRDEIPHGTAVVIERMRERQGKNIDGHRRHHPVRKGQPQGHDYRQKGRDAQKDCQRVPPGDRGVSGQPGQPAVLGQGARGLAQQRVFHPGPRV